MVEPHKRRSFTAAEKDVLLDLTKFKAKAKLEVRAKAVDERTARLKALRLAKEAQEVARKADVIRGRHSNKRA